MRNLCYICSAALIILGLVGYFGGDVGDDGEKPVTALIPSGAGLLMLLGGLVALKNNMAGMHIAVLFSALGTPCGLVPLIRAKGAFEFASVLGILMTAICLFFTVMAVRSFKAARRAREAAS